MTGTTPDTEDPADTAGRMAAIAAGLTAEGLDARVHDTHGVLDATASWHRQGSKAIDLTVDEDHYVHLSWWNPDDATPGQIIATIRPGRDHRAAVTAPG